jgi:hypothetical protein
LGTNTCLDWEFLLTGEDLYDSALPSFIGAEGLQGDSAKEWTCLSAGHPSVPPPSWIMSSTGLSNDSGRTPFGT